MDRFAKAGSRQYVPRCRDLARALIDMLDQLDSDPDLEDDEREIPEDSEPSLGSFDRMTNQEKSYRQRFGFGADYEADAELDDCDREDDDPAEEGHGP
jgi:hypothetical protein